MCFRGMVFSIAIRLLSVSLHLPYYGLHSSLILFEKKSWSKQYSLQSHSPDYVLNKLIVCSWIDCQIYWHRFDNVHVGHDRRRQGSHPASSERCFSHCGTGRRSGHHLVCCCCCSLQEEVMITTSVFIHWSIQFFDDKIRYIFQQNGYLHRLPSACAHSRTECGDDMSRELLVFTAF